MKWIILAGLVGFAYFTGELAQANNPYWIGSDVCLSVFSFLYGFRMEWRNPLVIPTPQLNRYRCSVCFGIVGTEETKETVQCICGGRLVNLERGQK
jgi:DNA-directed RNA polymerase subunit RPC12/RpoP